MTNAPRLSLFSAILINLNVMVGSGIFINTVLVSQNAGGLGAFAYAAVGLLLFPLILSISWLSKLHKGGSFYDYAAPIHPYAGFVAIASYFIAKLSSCALAVHVCVSLVQTIFPALAKIPTVVFDIALIALFAALNTLNLRVGKRIQVFFIICKFVPILFVILTGLYLFQGSYFAPEFLYPSGIVTTVPFILYAFMGFEVSCSLSRSLENPEKNGPRAMLISYGLGILIVCLFQLMFYGGVGPTFATLNSYLGAFPALLEKLQLSAEGLVIGKVILHLGIAASALGAAYGIMYSNAWNLFEMGSRNQVICAAQVTRLNRHNVPTLCVLVEAVIASLYLVLFYGNQVPMQQMASFGSTITYLLCCVGLVVALFKSERKLRLIPILGIGSCLLLVGSILKNAALYGVGGLLYFTVILLLGTGFAVWQSRSQQA